MNKRVANAFVAGASVATFLTGCSSSEESSSPKESVGQTTTSAPVDSGRPFPDNVSGAYEAQRDLEDRVRYGEVIRFALGKCIYWQNLRIGEGDPYEWVVITNPAYYSTGVTEGVEEDAVTGREILYARREEIFLSGSGMAYGVNFTYTRTGSKSAREVMGIVLHTNRTAPAVIDAAGRSKIIYEPVMQGEEGLVTTESGVNVMGRTILPAQLTEEQVVEYCYEETSVSV
jgi:hypothetical protein